MTVHPDGELDSILAESLHQRASLADTHGRGFGEVRRRVRRHRQRQMAAGLLPAVAGFGWIISRPVAHDPLSPGEGASGCDSTLPASTMPGLVGDATSTTMTFDTNGNGDTVPASNPEGTTTTYPFSTVPVSTIEVDGNGNPVSTTVAGVSVTETTWYIDANGNPTATMIVPGTDAVSTSMVCDDPTTMPPSTAPSVTETGDSTTTMPPMPGQVADRDQVHTVAKGDSLFLIASMYSVSLEAIADANGWPNGGTDHMLLPGDVIRIPAGAIVPLPTTTTSIG